MTHVIHIDSLSKIYKLYTRPIDRLKEALLPFGRKRHRDFFALKDISFSVDKGSCVGIIGLNGSGKSTLLQIIAGVLTPSSGKVEVCGRIAALLELGAGFNPEFTGIENIYFQCSIMGYRKEECDALLPGILQFADIGEFVHQPVKTYSSGMYVRLAFSVAINVDPDILIVDEALAVGDIRFQAKCMQKIRDFRASGKTLFFVSHDLGAVKSLCDHVYLLDRGKIVDHGAPERVFNLYNSLIAEKDRDQFVLDASAKGKLAERSGNQRAVVNRVRLLDEHGTMVDTLVSGNFGTIELTVFAHENITDPTFGILIRDRLGNDIFGINNQLLNIKVGEIIAGESYIVRYRMKFNLGATIYSITTAAHAGETHVEENFDWQNDVLTFRIIHASDYRFSGFCRLEPEFQFTRS